MALLDLRESIPEDLELLLAADEATQRPSTEAESGSFAARDPIWPRRHPRASISGHELEPSLEERHGGFAGDDRVGLSESDQRPQHLARGRHGVEIDLRMAPEPGH